MLDQRLGNMKLIVVFYTSFYLPRDGKTHHCPGRESALLKNATTIRHPLFPSFCQFVRQIRFIHLPSCCSDGAFYWRNPFFCGI